MSDEQTEVTTSQIVHSALNCPSKETRAIFSDPKAMLDWQSHSPIVGSRPLNILDLGSLAILMPPASNNNVSLFNDLLLRKSHWDWPKGSQQVAALAFATAYRMVNLSGDENLRQKAAVQAHVKMTQQVMGRNVTESGLSSSRKHAQLKTLRLPLDRDTLMTGVQEFVRMSAFVREQAKLDEGNFRLWVHLYQDSGWKHQILDQWMLWLGGGLQRWQRETFDVVYQEDEGGSLSLFQADGLEMTSLEQTAAMGQRVVKDLQMAATGGPLMEELVMSSRRRFNFLLDRLDAMNTSLNADPWPKLMEALNAENFGAPLLAESRLRKGDRPTAGGMPTGKRARPRA